MKRYMGMVGLGFIATWCLALIGAPLELTKSHWIVSQIFGYVLMLVVSGTCLTLFMYTSDLEQNNKELKERADNYQKLFETQMNERE